MFLASNCTCAVYFTYTAHVQLLAKNMVATHVYAICICNQTSTLRFCLKDNPLYVFTLRPYEVLEPSFAKASKIKKKIWKVPGTNDTWMMPSNNNPNAPHTVNVFSSGHVQCDKDCPNYQAYFICAHTIAVPEEYGVFNNLSSGTVKKRDKSDSPSQHWNACLLHQ